MYGAGSCICSGGRMAYLWIILIYLAIGCIVSYPMEVQQRRKNERLEANVFVMLLMCWPYYVVLTGYLFYKHIKGRTK
jgi:ABC-type arginine/histidine transport system permease subunit